MAEDPQFIVDDGSKYDITQNQLGDCWLIAPVSFLPSHSKLFEQVVPSNQSFEESNYTGLFHFRFWKYGYWVDVVVDDYLPTVDGELVFADSVTSNEFWPCLLEKAYAKLHGGYCSLIGGTNLIQCSLLILSMLKRVFLIVCSIP